MNQMIKSTFSLCVLLALCHSARAVSYTWDNFSGESAFGLWDVGATSYRAGQLAAIDSPLSFSFSTPLGQAVMNDIFVPAFTLSRDRSLLFVTGNFITFQAFGPNSPMTFVTFSRAADGMTSWSWGTALDPQPTFGGTGTWRTAGASVPETGSTLLMLMLGACFDVAIKWYVGERPSLLFCRSKNHRCDESRSSSRGMGLRLHP